LRWGVRCEWRGAGGPGGKCTRAARYILWKPMVKLQVAKDVSHWLKLGGVFFLRGGRCVTLKVPVTTSPKIPLAWAGGAQPATHEGNPRTRVNLTLARALSVATRVRDTRVSHRFPARLFEVSTGKTHPRLFARYSRNLGEALGTGTLNPRPLGP
jgi:hypothetical protein